MKRVLLFLLGITLLAGCASPEEGLVVSIPSREAVAPLALSGTKDVILDIFEESLLARTTAPEARDFVHSLRPSLVVSPFGAGIWEVSGKGRFMVRELGRSVSPMDAEARQLLATVQSMGKTETPKPVPSVPKTLVPTPTPRPTPTPTPRPTPTPTPRPTPTPTSTPQPMPTSTPLAAPPGWSLYRNQFWKYSIYVPSGWNAEESDPGRVTMTSPQGDTTIRITAGLMGKSLDEWFQETLRTIEVRNWEFELKSKERFKGAGFEAWKIAYRGRPSFTNTMNDYRDLFASDGETRFWVSSYTRDGYTWITPALELVIQSFRPEILPATPPWWQIGN
ncbi:MAG: hypothetical protein HY673_25460 [Chloroflexi bacterium]|nr:hypothetical protein [Chloroflexota bacterium]